MKNGNKTKSDQNKLRFNINYYSVFQNVKNVRQELKKLLTSGQEHKKIFQDFPVTGFCNGKSLEYHLVRAKLLHVEVTGSFESCRQENCQICEFICNAGTFSTKSFG